MFQEINGQNRGGGMRLFDIIYFYRGVLTEEAQLETPRLVGNEFDLIWKCTDDIQTHYSNGDTSKAMRFLGFVQGIFLTRGIYDINELKHHNQGVDD